MDTPLLVRLCPKGHDRTVERNAYNQCRACQREYKRTAMAKLKTKSRYEGDKIKWKRYSANYSLKQKYGITLEEKERMVADQGNRCAICTEVMIIPHVDHCHITGKVRKLLCSSCNMALGFLKDNIMILEKAIKYLQETA